MTYNYKINKYRTNSLSSTSIGRKKSIKLFNSTPILQMCDLFLFLVYSYLLNSKDKIIFEYYFQDLSLAHEIINMYLQQIRSYTYETSKTYICG